MKVIFGIGQVKDAFVNPVVVIGVFDGVHLGHQKLIKRAITRALAQKEPVVVLTFYPHPVHVLHPEIKLSYICSLEHRLKLIEKLGVDGCVVVRFTKAFSRLTPQRFIENYLIKYIHPKEIFVGDDFRFGKDRSGTLEIFKQLGQKYNFKVSNVHHRLTGNRKIGSSSIREMTLAGKLKSAEKLLGRDVCVMGVVTKGDQRGKSLGYPTANLYPKDVILPPRGVYAVRVQWRGQLFNGMANVGIRPSFKSHVDQSNVEVNILDFNEDLYGSEIIVNFIHRIRDERKFQSKEALIHQLGLDEKRARRIFS